MRLRLYSFLMGLVVEFYSILCICTEECKYDAAENNGKYNSLLCMQYSVPYTVYSTQSIPYLNLNLNLNICSCLWNSIAYGSGPARQSIRAASHLTRSEAKMQTGKTHVTHSLVKKPRIKKFSSSDTSQQATAASRPTTTTWQSSEIGSLLVSG